MRVTFLGTSSGGGPSETRNCSSLVVDALGNDALWMVDCAEGTVRQFALQTERGADRLKMAKVSKVFITHMHADHIMGLITLLRTVLRPSWFQVAMEDVGEDDIVLFAPTVEIYGPAGLRAFVRNCMVATRTRSADKYAVHELLLPDDPTTPCTPPDVLHESELTGRDIICDADGFWREFATGHSDHAQLIADAGPIVHRDPCIGYIFREPGDAGRSLVLLGDMHDPSAMLPLIDSLPGPPPALLVHEATDAYIPPHIDYKATRTPELVLEKCVERGHSTPDMAGAFARRIGAQRLVLNHIGSRFPAPSGAYSQGQHVRARILREIEDQASRAWGAGPRAIAAIDFMRVEVAPVPATDLEGEGNEHAAAMLVDDAPRDGGRDNRRGRDRDGRRPRSHRGGRGGAPYATRQDTPDHEYRRDQPRSRGGHAQRGQPRESRNGDSRGYRGPRRDERGDEGGTR